MMARPPPETPFFISLGASQAMIEKEEEAEIKLKKLQSELAIFEETQ